MIYMDYSATTFVKDEVLLEMKSYYKNIFANPSSMHTAGQHAKNALDSARERCAAILGAKEQSEIIFTSGGTESNNIATYGACKAFF